MMDRETSLRLYQELADRFDRLREAGKRDLFLVLAAEAALSLGLSEVAERLLHRLLAVSPHNLLKPYSSLAEALRSPDVQFYVEDLKRQFPPEKAERLLQELEDKSTASGAGDVYPIRDEAAPARPLEAPRAMSAKPALSGGLVKPAPARQPVSPYSFANSRDTSTETATDDSAGSWLAWLLFVVVLGLGLAAAWFAFVGPLL